jgi:hypothetical protein
MSPQDKHTHVDCSTSSYSDEDGGAAELDIPGFCGYLSKHNVNIRRFHSSKNKIMDKVENDSYGIQNAPHDLMEQICSEI